MIDRELCPKPQKEALEKGASSEDSGVPCTCDECSEARSVVIPVSDLRLLTQKAGVHLVFLADGGYAIVETGSCLHDLADDLEAEEEMQKAVDEIARAEALEATKSKSSNPETDFVPKRERLTFVDDEDMTEATNVN